MKLQMTGVDYRRASVEQRETFSLTKSHRTALATRLVRDFGFHGCVILSTCNRTEFWVSGDGPSLQTVLAETIGLAAGEYQHWFTGRYGKPAADYLFRLACGMESQIFGEDQILGQVKEAAELARTAGCMDSVLEVLFRTAVTGAKMVKTKVRLTPANHSIAEAAVELLQRKYPTLAGQPCLIIGSGEMGRLAARTLLAQHADVSITVRKNGCSHSIRPEVPAGCKVVDYQNRFAVLEEFPVVISATSSPHFTLPLEPVREALKTPHIFLDLAVPRDIDGRIGQLPMVSLFDLDHLGLQRTAAPGALRQAEQILRDYQEQFSDWYAFRELVPDIQLASRNIAEDAGLRLQRKIRRDVPEEPAERLQNEITQAVEKAVAKCFYGLKETLPSDLWGPCIHALKQSVQTEGSQERGLE